MKFNAIKATGFSIQNPRRRVSRKVFKNPERARVGGPVRMRLVFPAGVCWHARMQIGKGAILATVMFLAVAPTARASPPAWLTEAERIVFLGDSITYAGHYLAGVEAGLRRHDRYRGEWLNLGLPSETCTGLSEPDHPFPRPNVHERVERVLSKVRPDVVAICYGMNDGIYHPFDAQRFAQYRKGIFTLIEACRAAECRVMLLTPPPFDPLPLRQEGKLVPAESGDFSWTRVYEGYPDVLKKYAEWILTLGDRVDLVVDVHGPIRRYVRMKRETDPDFILATDGVHLNPEGHAIMTRAILEACGFEASTWQVPEDLLGAVHERQRLLRDAWLSETGHQRPGMQKGLPLPEALDKAALLEARIDRLVEASK